MFYRYILNSGHLVHRINSFPEFTVLRYTPWPIRSNTSLHNVIVLLPLPPHNGLLELKGLHKRSNSLHMDFVYFID